MSMDVERTMDNGVIELRQYTLFPGRRNELIALFESTFVAPQNAVGAQVIGTFRDLDDPERFVWLRGFASMTVRHAALTTFYGGAIWQANRDAAVATMRDSDNALLLRPCGTDEPFATNEEPGVFLAWIHDLGGVDVEAFVALFDAAGRPMLTAAGAAVVTWITEPAVNTFVRLPVRDAVVHVCLARFADVAALDAVVRRIGHAHALRDAAPDALLPAFMRKPEVLRLVPTEHSLLR